jgi:hypothetical protein
MSGLPEILNKMDAEGDYDEILNMSVSMRRKKSFSRQSQSRASL